MYNLIDCLKPELKNLKGSANVSIKKGFAKKKKKRKL